MKGVVLLSEVHPANMQVTNPIRQARDWHGLVKDAEIARWKRAGPPSLLQLVALCEPRVRAKGGTLLLRDWTHLDYIGVPYAKPAMGFGVRDALQGVYDVREAISVRHPLDQFVSTMKLAVMHGRLTPENYLPGVLAFAEHAAAIGFVRYEDFTADPEPALRTLCERLGIEYDAGWTDRWAKNTHVTGDSPGSGSRGSGSSKIVPLPRAPVPEALHAAFRADERYTRACELLGYEP